MKHSRMKVRWTADHGFKMDVPYTRWLAFCLGASLLIHAVRWW